MENLEQFLMGTPLFSGIEQHEIHTMMQCLSPFQKKYHKGEIITEEGANLTTLGLVISGQVHVEREDYWGNRSILGIVGEGDVFGEAYAVPGSEPIPNFIVAAKDSEILFLDTQHVLTMCGNSCHYHNMLIQNLFMILAGKNRGLAGKLRHMSRRSTRDKLLSYLSEQSLRNHTKTFDIPLDRQQLADYLSVDRSAMSAELSKLQKDGFIEYKKNHFTLIREEEMEM